MPLLFAPPANHRRWGEARSSSSGRALFASARATLVFLFFFSLGSINSIIPFPSVARLNRPVSVGLSCFRVLYREGKKREKKKKKVTNVLFCVIAGTQRLIVFSLFIFVIIIIFFLRASLFRRSITYELELPNKPDWPTTTITSYLSHQHELAQLDPNSLWTFARKSNLRDTFVPAFPLQLPIRSYYYCLH